MIGDIAAGVIAVDDSTIEAMTPPMQPGMKRISVINPDTQTTVVSEGFLYIGKSAYNYPNPFRASQGTTFRYVSKDTASSINVKIYNAAGVPIDFISTSANNEVKWQNVSLRAGIYIYLMEVVLDDGSKENHRGVLEIQR